MKRTSMEPMTITINDRKIGQDCPTYIIAEMSANHNGDYDQAVIYSILNEEPELASEIDESLRSIISRALAKNPDETVKLFQMAH